MCFGGLDWGVSTVRSPGAKCFWAEVTRSTEHDHSANSLLRVSGHHFRYQYFRRKFVVIPNFH